MTLENLTEEDIQNIWKQVDSRKTFNTDLLDDIQYMEYRMYLFEHTKNLYLSLKNRKDYL